MPSVQIFRGSEYFALRANFGLAFKSAVDSKPFLHVCKYWYPSRFISRRTVKSLILEFIPASSLRRFTLNDPTLPHKTVTLCTSFRQSLSSSKHGRPLFFERVSSFTVHVGSLA